MELDGSQHFDQSAYDTRRTREFEARGLRVVRFWNNDVLERTDDVLAAISAVLAEAPPPHPSPLPRQGRGRGSRSAAAAATRAQSRQATELSRSASEAQSRQPAELTRSDSDISPGLRANEEADRGAGAKEKPSPPSLLGGEGWVRGQRGSVRAGLELRSSLYALIRRFFAERDVLEVETPILSAGANTDPNIESFSTHFTGHVDAGSGERWLRTSSEFAQKRLLAAGVGDCYELGRVFRNGEAGGRHNPEFTMLEWYRVGWDHLRLIDETVELVRAALAMVGRTCRRADQFTYRELFTRRAGARSVRGQRSRTLRRTALDDYNIERAGTDARRLARPADHPSLQPGFPQNRITVVHDYPAIQCALAKIRNDDPPVAERFELYLGPLRARQRLPRIDRRARTARTLRARQRAPPRARPARTATRLYSLLAALERGLPDCAGVALGIERLLMA